MAASISEVLNPAPAQPAASAPAPVESAPAHPSETATTTEHEAAAADGAGDDSTATPAVTPEASKPADDKRQVPIAALKDERRKRQELERKLADLEGQVKAYSQTVRPSEPTPRPNPEDLFYKDPVGFVNQRVAQERLAISEELVRSQHDDYDDVIQAFVEASRSAPHLVAQMQGNQNPARFAYQAGKAYLQARKCGSIDEMRTKIRAELKAEVLEEVKRESAKHAAEAVQPSLANARGVGTSPKPQWQGPTPMKQLLGR